MYTTIFIPYGNYILLSWHKSTNIFPMIECLYSINVTLFFFVFFFCCIRFKDVAKALTTTFFLRGLCGSAFLTLFIAFPRLCLDMSKTFTIIGLCAKAGLLSFSFSLLLSRQRSCFSMLCLQCCLILSFLVSIKQGAVKLLLLIFF